MRLRGSATVTWVDLVSLAAVPPALMRRWIELPFEDGVVVDASGARRQGLRVEAGAHPQVGTRYVVVTGTEDLPKATAAEAAELTRMRQSSSDPDAASRAWLERRRDTARAEGRMEMTWTRVSLELLDTSADSVRVRVQDLTTSTIGAVVSCEQARSGQHGVPVDFDVQVDGRIKGHWFVRGAVTGHATAVLDDSTRSRRPVLRVSAKGEHKRVGAHAEIVVEDAEADRVEVSIDIRVHGRGVVRPVAALAALFGGGAVRRGFASAMDNLPRAVAEFDDEMRTAVGAQATPDDIARRALDEFITTIPETVPDT
jgi:hypothetical protein